MAIDRRKGRSSPGTRKPTRKATAERPRGRVTPKRPVRHATPRAEARQTVDPSLFDPLTEGERADAIRVMLEDERLRSIAKVGRYRVVAVEPLVPKPPHELAGRRLGRVVLYDYAGDQSIDGCVDLEAGTVWALARSSGQPPLSQEEEATAIAIASADARLAEAPRAGFPLAVLHYWSRRPDDLASRRRSAAVLFGPAGARPAAVVVVDLVDGTVLEVVPASRW